MYQGYHAIPSMERMKKSCWFKVVSVLITRHPDPDVCFSGKIRVRRIAKPKKIKVNEKYKTIEEYAKDYHGYEAVDGKFGYYSNENAKWDWYELGGRWTGYFKLKPEAKGKVGNPGLMTEKALVGTADQALKKDIDFDVMYAENLENSIKAYDEFEKAYKENQEDAKKRAYFEFGIQNVGENFEHYVPESREQFLDRTASIATFAIVKDGKWYEKGKMGWWGFASDEKDPKDWNKEIKSLLDGIPDDTMISLYDCHI